MPKFWRYFLALFFNTKILVLFFGAIFLKNCSWLQLQACSAPDEHQQHNQKPDQKHTLFKNMELLQIVKVQE